MHPLHHGSTNLADGVLSPAQVSVFGSVGFFPGFPVFSVFLVCSSLFVRGGSVLCLRSKGLCVVYFDQRTGAPPAVRWPKSFF